ncbi:UNKNOWN [Stylonychia lemnae]|uniref:Uncharacterized protein n=1 Tax=Stylonychia lemnae TaxID=5949 RepID=A0A077ZRD5_STYLE|nr:UNKNOWN [Stylonychia lemnae]|eukprot:CDW72483.1 UNKNOWN [Stylonychia lemnae]
MSTFINDLMMDEPAFSKRLSHAQVKSIDLSLNILQQEVTQMNQNYRLIPRRPPQKQLKAKSQSESSQKKVKDSFNRCQIINNIQREGRDSYIRYLTEDYSTKQNTNSAQAHQHQNQNTDRNNKENLQQIDGIKLQFNDDIYMMSRASKRYSLNDQNIKSQKNKLIDFPKDNNSQNINLKLRLSLLAEKQKSERGSESKSLKKVMTELVKRLKSKDRHNRSVEDVSKRDQVVQTKQNPKDISNIKVVEEFSHLSMVPLRTDKQQSHAISHNQSSGIDTHQIRSIFELPQDHLDFSSVQYKQPSYKQSICTSRACSTPGQAECLNIVIDQNNQVPNTIRNISSVCSTAKQVKKVRIQNDQHSQHQSSKPYSQLDSISLQDSKQGMKVFDIDQIKMLGSLIELMSQESNRKFVEKHNLCRSELDSQVQLTRRNSNKRDQQSQRSGKKSEFTTFSQYNKAAVFQKHQKIEKRKRSQASSKKSEGTGNQSLGLLSSNKKALNQSDTVNQTNSSSYIKIKLNNRIIDLKELVRICKNHCHNCQDFSKNVKTKSQVLQDQTPSKINKSLHSTKFSNLKKQKLIDISGKLI